MIVHKVKSSVRPSSASTPKATKPVRVQCASMTEKKEPCLNKALKGSEFCRVHDPATLQAKTRQQQDVADYQRLVSKWVACQEELQECKNTIKSQETIIRQSEAKLVLIHKEFSALDTSTQEQLQRYELELEKLRLEKVELHKEQIRSLAVIKEERAAWESQRSTLQGKLRQQQADHTKYVETMQERSNRAKQEMEEWKGKLDKSLQQYAQLKSVCQGYKGDIRTLEAENQQLSSKVQSLEKEKEQYKQEQGVQKGVISELQAQVNDLKERVVVAESAARSPVTPPITHTPSPSHPQESKWLEQIHVLERQLLTRDSELQEALSQLAQLEQQLQFQVESQVETSRPVLISQ